MACSPRRSRAARARHASGCGRMHGSPVAKVRCYSAAREDGTASHAGRRHMSVTTAYGTDPSPPDFSHISPVKPEPRELSMRFTGSGSEYFRIWIVNLLLTLVTLTLYYPWAKVRRLRYFYGNTVVDGQPLGFHANPKKVL